MHERPSEAAGNVAVLARKRHGHGPLHIPRRFVPTEERSGHLAPHHRPTGPRFVPLDAASPAGSSYHPVVLTEHASGVATRPPVETTPSAPAPADAATVFPTIDPEPLEILDGKASRGKQNNQRHRGRQPSGPTRRDHPGRAAGQPPEGPPDNGLPAGSQEEPEGRTIAERHPDWNLDIQLVVGAHGNREEMLEGLREYVDAADIVFYEEASINDAQSLFHQELYQNAARPPVSSVTEYIASLENDIGTDPNWESLIKPNIVKFFGTGAIVRRLDINQDDRVTAAEIKQARDTDYLLPSTSFDKTLTRLLEKERHETDLHNTRDDIIIHEHFEKNLAGILAENPALQDVMKKRPLKVVIDRGGDHRFRVNDALREEGFAPEVIVRHKKHGIPYTWKLGEKLLLGKEPTKEDLARAHAEHLIMKFSYQYAFFHNLAPEKQQLMKDLDKLQPDEITEAHLDELTEGVSVDSFSWMKTDKFNRLLTHIVSCLSLEDIRSIHDAVGTPEENAIFDASLSSIGIVELPINEDELDEILYEIDNKKAIAAGAQ